MRPMKIALVILHADATRGGAERYTLDLADALVKRGHEVAILASTFQAQPVAGRSVVISTKGGMTRTGRYDAFLQNLEIELDRQPRFDVVHAMLPVLACDVYHPHAGIARDVIASGHLKKPTGIGRAMAWVGNRTNRRRLRFAAVEAELLARPNPPAVLCLSNFIKRAVLEHYPAFAPEKLVPLFNGIDLKKFDPELYPHARQEIRRRHQIPGDKLIALFISQDFERKGLGQAIRAVAGADNVVLLVAGRPDPSHYQKLAQSLGATERVIFTGPVDNPPEYYAGADFFLLPTRFDPCSLVVLEALAMGLPVISTVMNGACEIMQDGVHGRVLTDPENPVELSGAITELINPVRRAAMAESCLMLRTKLSQQAHLNLLEAAYRDVCQVSG
jgi:UDP-glucose:(heptosyl)LPS alpha-1,3-glucosyltransferase